ncbi:MAG: EAL domain-containing protein [Legionellales bacterium]|nr:EAL domain-containing protein [Legionellales bacterium]
MKIKDIFPLRTSFLKGPVNKYAYLGLGISITSLLIASILASYVQTGFIDISGILYAQKTNPALWALDLTPLLFVYWGQLFCDEMVSRMELMIENRTREWVNKSSDLELKLQYETNHDHLTKLPNQRLLVQRIKQGVEYLHKGEDLVLMIMHINSFKDINVKYGNFNANNVLIQFSEKLKSILLEPYLLQAYMGMNMVARLQGAEFAMLFPRLKKEHHFEDLVTKILVASSANFMLDGNSIQIITSAGIAFYAEGEDEMDVMHHASSALFYAEKEGFSHAVYDESMETSMMEENLKIKVLSDAIDHETLDIWYQPELELKQNTIIGFTTVIHAENGKNGLMPADKLLPLFEDASLMKKLTYLMLTRALSQLALCHQSDRKIYVTVPLFDISDFELPTMIEHLLKDHKIDSSYLKIELTEKVCLEDQTQSVNVLKKIADLGVRIVISDFGSGYASFTYLVNFPISEIKMDQSFMMNMMGDEKKLKIVKSIIKLAETMGVVVYADGIIDLATLKTLKQLGCIYGQGPYFPPAVGGDEMVGLLEKA